MKKTEIQDFQGVCFTSLKNRLQSRCRPFVLLDVHFIMSWHKSFLRAFHGVTGVLYSRFAKFFVRNMRKYDTLLAFQLISHFFPLHRLKVNVKDSIAKPASTPRLLPFVM